jgi:hypothetical protein
MLCTAPQVIRPWSPQLLLYENIYPFNNYAVMSGNRRVKQLFLEHGIGARALLTAQKKGGRVGRSSKKAKAAGVNYAIQWLQQLPNCSKWATALRAADRAHDMADSILMIGYVWEHNLLAPTQVSAQKQKKSGRRSTAAA